MDETWFSQIESSIFTDVQYALKTKQGAPFPELNCTTISQDMNLSVFPTLYLHELPALEVGQDLVNVTVNAVRCTIEIQVFSNKSEQEVRKILTAAIVEMKKHRFNVSSFPDPSTSGGVRTGFARFTRIYGNGDEI